MTINRCFDFFDLFKEIRMKPFLTCKPKNKKEKIEKKRICVRFPKDIKLKLKKRAEKEYLGRSKQSLLIEDALNYYMYSMEDINWAEYEKSNDYIELIDDIQEGLNQKNLAGATQFFITHTTLKKLVELEGRILLTKPTMTDIRAGLVRKAVAIRLSIDSKEFFDSLMKE